MAAGCCRSSPTLCCSARWRSCCCSDPAGSSAGKAERELVPGHTFFDRARRGANRASRRRPVLDESDYPSLHLRVTCAVGRSSARARWSLLALPGFVFRRGRLHDGHPPGSLRVSNDRGSAGGTSRRNAARGPLRLRGVYFILITIALGYIIWGAFYRWASFSGGDNGITNVPPPTVAGVSIASQTAYYYFVLGVVIVCAFGYRILTRSPFGLSLRGIKGSESRMQSLGRSEEHTS